MKVAAVCPVLLAVCVSVWSLDVARAADEYWISYNLASYPDYGKALMKINALGEIIQTPRRIPRLHTGPLDVGAEMYGTSLTPYNSSGLIYWTYSRDGTVYRGYLDKGTFSPVLLRRTNQKTSNLYNLQTVSEVGLNFAAFVKRTPEGKDLLYGVRTDERGMFQGESWPLFEEAASDENCDARECGGGVSADGRFAWLRTGEGVENNKLLVRPLDSQGYPVRRPVLIDRVPGAGDSGIIGADVTSILGGNMQYVVYYRGIGGAGSSRLHPGVRLQKIHAATGEKIGPSQFLYRQEIPRHEQAIAIDPKGRFIITLDYADLVFRALDATGNLSGAPKVLAVRGSHGGLNILED